MAQLDDDDKKILRKLWEVLVSPESKKSLFDNYRNTALLTVFISAGISALIQVILNQIAIYNSPSNQDATRILIIQRTALIFIIIVTVIACILIYKKFKERNKIPDALRRTYGYKVTKQKNAEYIYSELLEEFKKSPIFLKKEADDTLKYRLIKNKNIWDTSKNQGIINMRDENSKHSITITVNMNDEVIISYALEPEGTIMLEEIDTFLRYVEKEKKIFSHLTIKKDEAKDIQ